MIWSRVHGSSFCRNSAGWCLRESRKKTARHKKIGRHLTSACRVVSQQTCAHGGIHAIVYVVCAVVCDRCGICW
jgi:hypothetical protein